MNIQLRQRAIEALATAPLPVQKAFIKQINFLARDLRHPGLHAKKYDETDARWQARVTGDWQNTSTSGLLMIPTTSST